MLPQLLRIALFALLSPRCSRIPGAAFADPAAFIGTIAIAEVPSLCLASKAAGLPSGQGGVCDR